MRGPPLRALASRPWGISMPDIRPLLIGLEVHAQLTTRSKIFCGCSRLRRAASNTHTCLVCLGLPGSLPVLNRQAIRVRAIRAGLAVGCTIRETSIFARKNYFYPDLPKGYQISQYEEPLKPARQAHPSLASKTVRILRIHLEEDAGKNIPTPRASDELLVDLNRAGVPLIEIVSEPDIANARGGRRRLPQGAAQHPPLPRRQRRQPRGGLAALRRQRQRGREGRDQARHPRRAEEHEQLPLPAPGHRLRDRPAERAPRVGRTRGAGDARLRPDSTRARRERCAPRKRRTTTATSPSPTCRRCTSRPTGSPACGPSCPSSPWRAHSATRRSAWAPPRPRCSSRTARLAELFEKTQKLYANADKLAKRPRQ